MGEGVIRSTNERFHCCHSLLYIHVVCTNSTPKLFHRLGEIVAISFLFGIKMNSLKIIKKSTSEVQIPHDAKFEVYTSQHTDNITYVALNKLLA